MQVILSHLDYILIATAVAVAAFFLSYQFGTVPPPYPWTDETFIAADAVETLTKGPQLAYSSQLGGGSLAVYVEAVFIALFGKSLLGLRLLNALVSLGLVVMTYALCRAMFAGQGKLSSQLLAGLASTWLASSTWFLAVGRIAFLIVSLMPLTTTACFYLLWRGLETGQWRHFISSGLILALSLYGYVPAVFIPAMLALFFASEWAVSRLKRRASLLQVHWRRLAGMAGVTAVASLPLVLSFLLDPQIFLRRPAQIAVNSQLSWQLFSQNLYQLLSGFGFLPQWLLQGRGDLLILDQVSALFFLIGFALAVVRIARPPQLFSLLWWAALTLPAALSASGVGYDQLRRGVGAAPVTFTFPALALVSIGQRLWPLRPRLVSIAGPAAAAAILVFSGLNSFQYYFVNWANSPEIPSLFNKEPVRFAEWLTEEAAPDEVYVFPLLPGASFTTRPELYAIRHLYDGKAGMSYPVLDEETIPAALTDLSAGRAAIELMLPDTVDVDPKKYLDFLLEQHATLTDTRSRFNYTIKTYRLNSASEDFSQPGPVEQVNARFEQAMMLVDYRANLSAPPAGETLRLILRWRKLFDTDRDYNVGLSLVDGNGHSVALADKPLLDNPDFHFTSRWAEGEEAQDYYSLPIPAYTPPGDYTLRAVIYDRETDARLIPADPQPDQSYTLAKIKVEPARLPVDLRSLSVGLPVEVQVADGLRIIGLDCPSTVRPGRQTHVSLTWQAESAPGRDYSLALGLTGKSGPAYVAKPQPVSASYPTAQWRPGETLQAHYTLLLPPDLPSGDYTLGLRLLDSTTGVVVAERALHPLKVEARTHTFTAPNPAHPLSADFGGVIRLLGYDQPAISQTADEATVQIYWQALAETAESYKVFAHLVDSNGAIVAQSDFIPQNGEAPTTSWVNGEIIGDAIRLQLPKDTPASTYRLIVGLYSETTGSRLPTSDNGDSLLLTEVAHGG